MLVTRNRRTTDTSLTCNTDDGNTPVICMNETTKMYICYASMVSICAVTEIVFACHKIRMTCILQAITDLGFPGKKRGFTSAQKGAFDPNPFPKYIMYDNVINKDHKV